MAATPGVVDLSNVKEGGGGFRPKRKPAGEYKAKIVKADDHQPNDKSKPKGWVVTVQIDGDARSSYPYYLSPAENQVWKISQVCRAAGLNVKNVRVRFDPNKLVGKAVGVLLEDDEYEGRLKSVIDEMFPVSEVGNAADDVPEGDEVYDDDEPVEDEDEPEPEPAPKPRRRKPAPEPEPEPEEDEDGDYEDEEPEPEPAPKRRRAAPAKTEAPARKRAAKPEPVEEEDDDLDLDDLDEV
jgi:hypothetical protein